MAYPQPALTRTLSILSAHLPLGLGKTLLLGSSIVMGGLACGLVTVYGGPWLGFLLLAEGVYVMAVLARPFIGIIGTISVLYLLPFGVNPVPFGMLHLTFLDISLTVTLLAWVLRLISRPQQRLLLSPLGAPILLFLGLAAVALLFGIAWVSGERLRLFLKMVNSILFFFTVLNVLRTRWEIARTAQVILLGAGVAGAIALALYILPASPSQRLLVGLGWLGYPTGEGVLRYIADTSILRAIGTAIDPNVLGGMLMISFPLMLSQLFERRPVIPRAVLGAVVLAAAAALLLSYSRSAWFGAMAGLLILGVLRYRRTWVLGGLVVVLVVLLPQGRAFVERFQSGVSFSDRAAQMRLGEYEDALRLISQYPVLGVGFGEAPGVDLYVATSSIYLLMAEEMGLVGLGAFVVTLGVFFWVVLRYRRIAEDRGLGSIQIGALAGVVGALSAGLFDHYFFNMQFPHTIALFWLFMGLTAATTVPGRRGGELKAAA